VGREFPFSVSTGCALLLLGKPYSEKRETHCPLWVPPSLDLDALICGLLKDENPSPSISDLLKLQKVCPQGRKYQV
jgi:hypothetical protein